MSPLSFTTYFEPPSPTTTANLASHYHAAAWPWRTEAPIRCVSIALRRTARWRQDPGAPPPSPALTEPPGPRSNCVHQVKLSGQGMVKQASFVEKPLTFSEINPPSCIFKFSSLSVLFLSHNLVILFKESTVHILCFNALGLEFLYIVMF